MRASLSPVFVESFIGQCHAAGLTKEAAAQLLQQQSVIHVSKVCPAFGEGFAKQASITPRGLQPIARPEWFTKQAGGWGKALKYGIPALATGAGALWGGAKIKELWPSPESADAPSLDGTYDPKISKQHYQDDLSGRAKGLADIESRISGGTVNRRAADLQAAVDSNSADSGVAMKELNSLNRNKDYARKAKQGVMNQSLAAMEENKRRLDVAKKKQSFVEGYRKSNWSAPQRFFDYMRGKGWDHLDTAAENRINALQNDAAQAGHNYKLSQDLYTNGRLGYAAPGTGTPVPSREEITAKLFPTR